ncbi:MAG: ribosome maturation factor RimM [Bacteroidia bacterium]|jgi:16S rRNA processing protein RimM|nr:ribosome maturation factor RimM [Bacteroidia bacterium]
MNLLESGYFSRTHGTKGQLVFKSAVNFEPKEIKVIFIDISGSKAPYFVEDFKIAASDLVLSLEGIDSPEKAKTLVNKKIFLEDSLVLPETEQELLGYAVHEALKGFLGEVKDLSENGAQQLLHLNYEGKEIILPMVEDFIEAIDHEKREIRYRAPEGLIELYLEEE